MSVTQEVSTADVADRHRQRLGWAMLAVSLMYGAKAVETAAVPGTDPFTDPFQLAMAVVAMALVVSIAYWKLRRLPGSERHLYFGADGFVMEAFGRGQKISWTTTFLLLLLLEVLVTDRDFVVDLPPGFFLQATVSIMLGVASISFLTMAREEADAAQETRG